MTETAGLDHFRTHCHALAKYGAELVSEAFQLPLPTDTDRWHGTMALAELPPGDAFELREVLWQQYQIEIPIIAWKGRRLIRISAHLYNTQADMELLATALRSVLEAE